MNKARGRDRLDELFGEVAPAASEPLAEIGTYYITPSGSNVEVKLRLGVTDRQVGELIAQFAAMEIIALEMGWTPKPVGQQAGAKSRTEKREEEPKRVEWGFTGGLPPDESPYGPDEGVERADFFHIMPEGDRTRIEFWRKRGLFHSFVATLPRKAWTHFLKDVLPGAGADFFAIEQTVETPVDVHWEYARDEGGEYKLNLAGDPPRPWRNIREIVRRGE